jgi:hypothetical protein
LALPPQSCNAHRSLQADTGFAHIARVTQSVLLQSRFVVRIRYKGALVDALVSAAGMS